MSIQKLDCTLKAYKLIMILIDNLIYVEKKHISRLIFY